MIEDNPDFMMNLRFPIGVVTDASLTIRGNTVDDIQTKTMQAMERFASNINAARAARLPLISGSRDATNGTHESRQCTAHGVAMSFRTPKSGGSGWYSHREGNGWCKGGA